MQAGINITDKKFLLACEYVDHFVGLDTTRWNTLEADANGDVAHDVDGANGIVQLLVTTTDNEEAYLYSNELFDFDRNKSYIVWARLQFAEAATDDANVMFGLMEGVAANSLQDNGAGPAADYDGALFFKVDGGTRWQFETSEGTAQETTDLDYTAGGASYHTLAIQVMAKSATELEITPWIDPLGGNNLKQARPYGVSPRVPLVKHNLTLASTTGEMAVVVGLKNGGANSETVNVDLIAYALDL